MERLPSLLEIVTARWAKNAEARNIDATVGMYDPEMGRLLGTVDEAGSPRRDTIPKIREYFEGFLGGHQAACGDRRPFALVHGPEAQHVIDVIHEIGPA